MNNDYYQSPKPTWMMRRMWKFCGADEILLSRTTYTEQAKYFCIGGLIFTISLFGFLAGAYGFYTVFKIDLINDELNLQILYMVLASLFGLLFSWFITHINRFVYISTSKGDGTEAITFNEFILSVPKMVLVVIISLCVSIPIAVGLLEGTYDINIVAENKLLNFSNKVQWIVENHTFFLAVICVFIAIIALTPLLMKLMLTKGPYDHMEENIEKLANAEMGIEVVYNYFEDANGKRFSKVINHPVEHKLSEKKKLLDAQRRINDRIIRDYLKAKENERPN